MRSRRNRRTIAIPGQPNLDLTPIYPLINTPQFQRLSHLRQLGPNYIVFISAHHSRLEHSLGTYGLTCRRVKRWRHEGSITPAEGHNLCLFALLHDIGHGPYCHDIEPLCSRNHKDQGLLLLNELEQPIRQCEGDLACLQQLFQGTHRLRCAISHRPLGTDKLDYLSRDALHTVGATNLRVDDLLNHIHIHQAELIAERKTVSEIMQAQHEYAHMYERVYLRKACLIAKRYVQKLVAREMRVNSWLTEDRLWQMTDAELDALLFHSPRARVGQLFRRFYENSHRLLPKMAVALVSDIRTALDRRANKPVAMFQVSLEKLHRFNRFQNPFVAAELEQEIAAVIDIPEESILMIPVVTPEKLMPDDISVYDDTEYVGQLSELYPCHYQHLTERIQTYAAVRVCVFPEHRQRAVNQAARIYDLLMAHASVS